MSDRRSKVGANIPCLLFRRSLFPRHQRHPHAAADLASNFVDELSRIKYRGRRRGDGRSGPSGGGGMALLRSPAVSSPHVGPIHCLDVDNASGGRFLLAGGHDGTVSVYDLFQTRTTGPVVDDFSLGDGDGGVGVSGARGDTIKPLHRSRRGKRTTPTGFDDNHDAPLPRGHVGPVSAVQWYPVDSGMFVSSSSDGTVMLWDASTCRPAHAFPIGNKSPRRGGGGGGGSDNLMHPVTCAEMPRLGDNHCLVASGCADDVYLCDVDSGSATHKLVGHTDRVLAVRWSPCQPYHLVSSSGDGTIRLWDVRRSGSTSCLHVFDGEDRLLGSDDYDESDATHDRMRRKLKVGSVKKRMRHGPNAYAHVQGASSTVRSSRGGTSSSAVTNVAFSPDGMYLTSATADGRIALWDVRGLNCPTPSPSLDDDTSSSKRSSSSSLSMWTFNYPPVLSPSYFLGSGEAGTIPASRGHKAALVVTQPGSSKSAMIWCGNDDGQLLGFDVHGGGGRPRVVLDGHLEGVSSIAVQEGYMRLFTGSRDGMILAWGCPPVSGAGTLGEGFLLGGSVGGGNKRRRRRGVDEDCWNDYGDRRSRGLSFLTT